MGRKSSIRTRWMVNGVLIVLAIVIVAVAAFAVAVHSYYYSSVRSSLEAKAKVSSDFFTTYISKTYAEYYQSAYKYTESFEEKNTVELQFINTRGRVEVSSYGMTAGTVPGTPDIADALSTGQLSWWIGRSADTGERIMAVSSPLLHSGGSVVGLMRYVTSLKLVDRQITVTACTAAGIGAAILVIIILSNTYFLRSITEPIRELTKVARRIAEGSYGTQAEKRQQDELGDLTDTINEMSIKIKQSEKMQTEFISSISHELRTPLTAITGWSETLLYDETMGEDSRRGLMIISKEAGRLTKMVEDLLEFTRIQDGRFNLNVEDIELGPELEEVIFTYSELMKREGMILEYSPPDEDLPTVSGDSQRLRQVFLNILDNAAKYGKSGGRILVTAETKGRFACIRVRDFGPGIPPAELPYVKQKFYKGSSRERGSGIGLAVCDEIVLRHGGRLRIANAADGGAEVTVMLPAKNERNP